MRAKCRAPTLLVCTAVVLAGRPGPTLAAQSSQIAPDTTDQSIVGVAIDDSNDRPIADAAIALLQGSNRLWAVRTDSLGRFRLPVPLPGFYRLELSRLGYALTVSQPVVVETGLILTVEFRVLPDAILLQPILVTARSDQGRSIFEKRREEWGRGIYLTPAMVDSINPRIHPAEVFRGQEKVWLSWGSAGIASGHYAQIPNIRTYLGEGCLTFMVDRVPVRRQPLDNRPLWATYPLDGLRPEDIVAVEIYRYVGEAPPELRRHATRGMAMCGLVVFWTHAGW